MVLPRPLILAIAGLALVLLSFVVVQRQRTVADSVAAPDPITATAPATPAADPPKVKPPASRERSPEGTRDKSPSRRPKTERPSRPAPAPEPAPARPAGDGVPAPVSRALADGRVIALLFTLEGAADDSATRSALRSLEAGPGKGGVAVFTDSIANVGRYSRLVGGLGISQVPSVVIVDTKRQAQLLEGFVDSGTLRQYVADAKR